MLKIIDVYRLFTDYLTTEKEKNGIEKFKVFVRLNFTMDVHIVLTDSVSHNKDYFYWGFEEYLKDKDVSCNFRNYKLNIFVHPFSDLNSDYVSSLFIDDDNNIYTGQRYRLNSYFNQFQSDQKLIKSIPIVTFYSYKGGMGRTTTMVSYAIDLAINHKKKVFLIDCDLEAPGYLNFFNLSKHSGLNSGSVNGLVEFLCDCKFSNSPKSIDLGDYCINVASGNEDSESALSNIYLMPAGNLNENLSDEYKLTAHINRESYLEGLSRLDLSDELTLIDGFQILLNKVQETIAPDIILIDSRTGFNDIIGTATMYFSDVVVGFFGFNEQTVPGFLSLIDNYYNIDSQYKLAIVSSILPKEGAESLVDHEKKLILQYIDDRYEAEKDMPSFCELHRSKELECLGTIESSTDDYLSIIRNNKITDYSEIFSKINALANIEDKTSVGNENPSEIIGIEVDESSLQNKRTLELRNIILKNLKETLSSINSFAETTNISEKIFFYRECMNDFFDEEKYIIRGYKGTGKTFLYKALADPSQKAIAENIIKRANLSRIGREEITYTPKFVDIISIEKGKNKSFDFVGLNYSKIEDPDYFFNAFWQIHTWNSILLDPEFEEIRKHSNLSDYIKEIKGNEAIKRFRDLIESGIDTLIEIENDFEKINEYLKSHNKKLFLLYDQLDTRINTRYWDKVVSPLINYWREKWNSYSNILPKIFVRTDLFNNNLRGTNTARLSENIISIEWTIEEIFAYFFKLVFSNTISTKAFWVIALSRIGVSKTWVENIKKQFAENNNQFKYLDRSNMDLAVQIFFGKEVKVGSSNLGRPWDYFRLNLSNADNNSISIRPFINTLDNNAIELALMKLIKYGWVKEIIHSEIYASRQVRIFAAETYFKDLTKDNSLQDLIWFKDFINSDRGQDYRCKTLDESQFNNLINTVFEIKKDEYKEVSSPEDLKTLLYACGIMHEHFTREGKLYSFAPMYVYSWGLKSSSLDDKVWINTTNQKRREKNEIINGIIEFDGTEYHCGKYALKKTYTKNGLIMSLDKKNLGKKITYKRKNVVKNTNKGSKYEQFISLYEIIE